MRKLFLTAVALLAGAANAVAADMVVKANPFVNYKDSGWYIGAGTSAAVASENVSGNVFTLPGATGGGVTAAGGTIDADIGFIKGQCILNTWCQVELDGKYTNISGSTAVGTLSTQWAITQEIDVGADLVQSVFAAFSSLNNPFPTFNPSSLLPANIAVATTPRGYFGFKQEELLINGNVGQSGGQTWAYAPGVTAGWRWQTINASGQPNGRSLKVFADVLWPTKGVSIANVFGVGGAPMVTQANASLKTLFVAGVHLDFDVSGR